jgi:hypothetical protein
MIQAQSPPPERSSACTQKFKPLKASVLKPIAIDRQKQVVNSKSWPALCDRTAFMPRAASASGAVYRKGQNLYLGHVGSTLSRRRVPLRCFRRGPR